MKLLSFLLLFFIQNTYSQSASTLSNEVDEQWNRPKNLKSLKISLKGSTQNNPGLIDQGAAESKGISKDRLSSELIELGLTTKWLFKPIKKLILIDTIELEGKIFTNIENDSSSLPFQNQYKINNDLIGVYILNKNNQVGNFLRTNFVQGNSFEVNFNKDGIQELNDNHFVVQNMLFYQYRFNKSFSSRINAGAKLTDYKASYSSFDGAEGEQEDNLASVISIENKIKVSNLITLKVPLSYRKEYYKNKIATNRNGTFDTGPIRERETLEVFEVGPELNFNFKNLQLTTGVSIVRQEDVVQGGRDYKGYRARVEASTQIEEIQLSGSLSLNDFKYSNALIDLNQPDGRKWREKGYSLTTSAKVPLDKNLNLVLAAQKDVAKDNFFAGKYNNEIYQMGLEFNL